MPFGGWGGERLPVGQAAPAPPQPLVIERPPWAGEMGAGAFAERPAPVAARLDAVAVMRAQDGETSSPEPPGSQVVLEPLIRPLPPPPDWRAEEAERERQRAAEVQQRLEPTRDPYLARPAWEKPARWPA